MDELPEFKLAIVEPAEPYAPSEQPETAGAPDLITAPAEALETLDALKATAGAAAVVKRLPVLDLPAFWLSVASFSVLERSGTARALRVAGQPGARIQDDALLFGLDGPLGSSVADCIFDTSSAGQYTLTVRLVNWAGPIAAIADCFIDGTSFGRLSVSGPTVQPHVANLSNGRHSFQVRPAGGGPFYFLSLKVWYVPVNAPI